MYGISIHHNQCGCHGLNQGHGQGLNQHCNRHFLTTQEKLEKLEEYKTWLENELKGVQETIDQIKKE
jgi:hypothetical protein